MSTTTITLTEAQIKALRGLSTKEFEFPGKGLTRSCQKLEEFGLAESSLQVSVWDSRRGVTTFSRAYRLTAMGKKFQGAKR